MKKEYNITFDSYMEVAEPENTYGYMKQSYWALAIGLQQVDNLTPSKYMKNLINESINENLDNQTLEKMIQKYYESQDIEKSNILEEKECDLVSIRIVELLENDNFELSIDFIKEIHKYLFKDVYEFNGKFRQVDITKNEYILNGNTVNYSSYETIEKSLEYDIEIEKTKEYSNMSIVEVINNISTFTSNIWQVHPFREGNTRTTAVFIIKYLKHLGYSVNNHLFKENSIYFRNSLVRSNYFNNELNVKEDNTYLIKFYENLLLNNNNNLQSRDIMVDKLFD